ncbi:MAG: glutamate formimidoyltransferase [Sphingobacteriales bacterium]|nr:MAG: glutamate formimidoyltransferase [Sphingobacteriales bacterium]
MDNVLLECVPNFSEGQNLQIIQQINEVIQSVEGIRLLDTDPGKATNRTVVTFVGEPDAVIEAAFLAIKKASELIDMSKHKGEHPRFGATDVCPLIPISGITLEEAAIYANKLGERVGRELKIPVYLYESAASKPERKNLATVRAGEYEGLSEKLKHPDWIPDYGPSEFNEHIAKTGAIAIGARDFLVAYNINLNTTSVRRANAIAFDIREAGRVVRIGHPVTGEIMRDENGEPIRKPGVLKSVKAIGWYIEEYGIAQISMNLTNISITPIHIAFEEVCQSAQDRGIRVTGSEIVGLVPLKAMIEAGKYFLRKQQRSVGVAESELIKIAVKSLGLDDLALFDPKKKIIEYVLKNESGQNSAPLVNMSLLSFAEETASESPAPGGGSVSAYIGALGVSLATMVANLSSHKRGWDDRWEEFSNWAEKGQLLKDQLLFLVDEDTRAFNGILHAVRLPKQTETEKSTRLKAIEQATKQATETPFKVMEIALQSMEIIQAMAQTGNPNSMSDAAVGALCAYTAVKGAFLNVCTNAKDLTDKEFAFQIVEKANNILNQATLLENEITAWVLNQLNK